MMSHVLFFFTLLLVWEVCMTIAIFFFYVCVFSSERTWASAWKRGTVDLCYICRRRPYQHTNSCGLPWTSQYFGMHYGYCSVRFFHLFLWLNYCTYQASTEAGAAKVYELLQGKIYRSVGWSTLFDCLSIYEEKFKKSIQSSASILPDFPEGDAQALVAYLAVLQKVWNFLHFLFICFACLA